MVSAQASDNLNHDGMFLPPINAKANAGKLFMDMEDVAQSYDDLVPEEHEQRGPREDTKVNVPAGLPGKFDHYLTAYEKKEMRMLDQRVPEIIWLRVYHVTSLNKFLLEWLGFGFYHTSVELYNHEFAYGGHDLEFSGIVCVETN